MKVIAVLKPHKITVASPHQPAPKKIRPTPAHRRTKPITCCLPGIHHTHDNDRL
jgi:hypothetical protein